MTDRLDVAVKSKGFYLRIKMFELVFDDDPKDIGYINSLVI